MSYRKFNIDDIKYSYIKKFYFDEISLRGHSTINIAVCFCVHSFLGSVNSGHCLLVQDLHGKIYSICSCTVVQYPYIFH